jgi:hypothetical protein
MAMTARPADDECNRAAPLGLAQHQQQWWQEVVAEAVFIEAVTTGPGMLSLHLALAQPQLSACTPDVVAQPAGITPPALGLLVPFRAFRVSC